MMKHDNSNQNPWAGLSSYEDPAKSEQKLKFCGRDNETKEVARLIDDNFFVTLYGKSGIGKTSLLNAGVFPALRREQYTPLSLRLGMTEETQNFQDIITAAIERAIEEYGGSVRVINVVNEQTDRSAIDYLWNWFARHCFLIANDQATFPVIVFDQFEEVFRHSESRQKTEVLLTQLHYLIDESHALNDCIVNGEQYYYDFNFRFVLSIREDDLYRLEDSIDNCALTALKRCRYRLRSLSEQNAEAVILVPGEGLFKEEDQKGIVDTIIDIARNKEDKSISTNVLSLICSRIFVDFKKSGTDHITPSLVDSFIKGNPFERFYNEATRGFSNKEKSYIEDNLVDSTGRRNSIPESDLLLHVPKGQQLLEGDTRILQRTSTSSDGGNYRIELIHDSFCEPLAGQKEKRERRKRLKWLAITVAIVLLCGGVTAYILSIASKNLQLEGTNQELIDSLTSTLAIVEQERDAARLANQQKDSANVLLALSNTQLDSSIIRLSLREQQLSIANQGFQTNLSRIIAEKAVELVDEGDSYTARLLALQALEPNRPYVVEAEWALRKACQKSNSILYGHTDGIRFASFSPDGKLIVSSSCDGTIRLWESSTGRFLRLYEGHTGDVNTISFSPNGQLILSASEDGTIRIWEVSTGRCLHIYKGKRFSCSFFSPDGKFFVSASDSTARIWDISTGNCMQTLKGHTDRVHSALYSPDGRYVVTSSSDRTVRIWDVLSGCCLNILKGHSDGVYSASYSPDGLHIVSGAADHTIRVWDASSGKCLKKMEHEDDTPFNTSQVFSTAFSPDSKSVISASGDNTIRIWDVSSGNCLRVLRGHLMSVNSAFFSPNGRQIVSASRDKSIRVWDITTDFSDRTLKGHKWGVKNAVFSHDGHCIASASEDGTIRIWSASSGYCTKTLKGHRSFVLSTSFSPNDQLIASASLDNDVRIWDASSGDLLKVLKGHIDKVNTILFSPNGQLVVSTSRDKTIRIWDATSGRCVQTLNGHDNDVTSASFSPDGKYILSASWDKTIRKWEVKTGKCIQIIHTPDEIQSVSFSSNGRLIVSAHLDYTLRIWNSITGDCLNILRGHTGSVLSASFSPDNHKIVSSSFDKTIRVWDVSTGLQIGLPLMGHTHQVLSAAFSPDGRKIVSASADSTIKIWDFPPLQELIDESRERFKNRQLTPEERRKYYLE